MSETDLQNQAQTLLTLLTGAQEHLERVLDGASRQEAEEIRDLCLTIAVQVDQHTDTSTRFATSWAAFLQQMEFWSSGPDEPIRIEDMTGEEKNVAAGYLRDSALKISVIVSLAEAMAPSRRYLGADQSFLDFRRREYPELWILSTPLYCALIGRPNDAGQPV